MCHFSNSFRLEDGIDRIDGIGSNPSQNQSNPSQNQLNSSLYSSFINLSMKKKSGNISILVIFVLLASSLLGILSMNFVQQMMKQSAVVHNYYKAYYLSKAGLEISLAQVASRDIGFEYIISN